MHRVTPPLEIEHGAVEHRQQPLPAGFGQRTVAVEQASEMGQIRRSLDGDKERNHEGKLGGRLAAGDGNPAQQWAVAAQQGQHLGHRHGGSLGIGTARADIQTSVAIGAERCLPMNLAFAQGQGAAWADRKAVTAIVAQPYGVRVVAAGAAKVAPLQKQHQPVARPVDTGERQHPAYQGAACWQDISHRCELNTRRWSIRERLLAVPAAGWQSLHSPRHRDRWSAAASLLLRSGPRRSCGSCSRSPAPDRCRPRWR